MVIFISYASPHTSDLSRTQTELRGVRGLLPSLLSAIDYLYKNNVTADEKLRAACVHIISYAVPLGNLYGDMKFSHSPDKRISSYNDLKTILPQLLSVCLCYLRNALRAVS